MGYVPHGGEGCVGDIHFLVLGLGRDRHHGYGLASPVHTHNWAPLDDVKQGSHEHSMMEEVSKIAIDGGTDQGAISQPHDNRFHFGHVILLVLHPNHSEHLELGSGPHIAEEVVGEFLNP
jgi:hypothetical protein